MKRPCLQFTVLFFLFGFAAALVQAQPASPPKLTVVIAVDQMRPDHLTRFEKLYEHGFARLGKEGAVFLNAHQYHAQTATGPGHASISSGSYPSRSGVVGNNWFDRVTGKYVYCSEDLTVRPVGEKSDTKSPGRSPRQMRTDDLGVWLKKAHRRAKVFGVGRKDRAATLMGGGKADAAYWYSGSTGNMISSTYYMKSYPKWVDDFNAAHMLDQYFDKGWQKLLPDEAYELAREDEYPYEADGKNTTFPHLFNKTKDKPDGSFYGRLAGTPFTDEYVLKFAVELIKNEGLGADDVPDLLFVGCSAADGVGHSYGPFSQESMDHFLRLDRYLGEFFAFLDEKIGVENYIVALTSDHGVLPLPEELKRRGVDAERVNSVNLREKLGSITEEVGEELGVKEKLILGMSGNGVLLNYDAAKPYNVSKPRLDEVFAEKLKALEEIDDVFTKAELESNKASDRPYIELYRNSYHKERTGDLMLRFKKHRLVSGQYGTSHGSPYEYDTNVPIVFWGKGIQAKQDAKEIKTVDIAPTLAELLQVKVRGKIDGESVAGSISK